MFDLRFARSHSQHHAGGLVQHLGIEITYPGFRVMDGHSTKRLCVR